MTTAAAFTILLCSMIVTVASSAVNHRYLAGDPVPFYANKVGPYHNPSETYRYFDLPFCSPERAKDKFEALGEVLNGDRLVDSPYKVDFHVDVESKSVCRKKLTKEDVAKFRNAVSNDYYFQMYFDDLPVWGFIGKVDKDSQTDPRDYKYFLYSHIRFTILYNNDRVIEIDAHAAVDAVVDVTEDEDTEVEFLYSVKWEGTSTPFASRMDRFLLPSMLPHQLRIHWFSIINSCGTVLLLVGFFGTILLRILKNDFRRYAEDDESGEDQDETGWKNIHGDVFRFPTNKSLFAAFIGSGTQLIALTIFIFILAIIGVFYPYNRGALFTALVVIYTLTSGIAGYVAANFYRQIEGTNWVPCRTTKYPREIPQLPWCRGTVPQMAIAGFLPFSAIYMELYYVFTSIWGHRVYAVYSILFLTFVILVIVTAFVTVTLTYFQLAAEDHKWWWRSFLSGGSTGLFIYGYCFYYYYARSYMSGFMQTSFFFGYMACVSYGFFLMLGTVAFHSALCFVRYIYRSIKCE
ncbi:Transmembrane 9 superfamily member 3 [Ananas comosus]|uniref:Transmembrane 9 superfamily member n=1 Tax=Ananas comosus TaxID=4615 RepID=A0A199UUY1_ANACO|nr:Transmembrane 9 superfamily member 3 [Ananas comosus]